jgi:hypothetical protein
MIAQWNSKKSQGGVKFRGRHKILDQIPGVRDTGGQMPGRSPGVGWSVPKLTKNTYSYKMKCTFLVESKVAKATPTWVVGLLARLTLYISEGTIIIFFCVPADPNIWVREGNSILSVPKLWKKTCLVKTKCFYCISRPEQIIKLLCLINI